jgi:single-strand DNA-binding protein
MNKVFLRGNLTRDVETKQSSNGNWMARFGIAVRRDFKNADGEYDSDFINCLAYNKIAEMLGKYFHKGSGIIVIGHIQTGSYDDRDGKKVYTTDVIVETVEFDRSNSTKEEKEEKPKVEEKPKQKLSNDPFADFGRQMSVDDDLPF